MGDGRGDLVDACCPFGVVDFVDWDFDPDRIGVLREILDDGGDVAVATIGAPNAALEFAGGDDRCAKRAVVADDAAIECVVDAICVHVGGGGGVW